MTIKSVQRRHVENRYSKSAIAADAVAITHFCLANFLFLIGEWTDLFKAIDVSNAGWVIVNEYIDAPIYNFFKGFVGDIHSDGLMFFMSVELVIIVSSVVYALITYAFFKAISLFTV